MDRLREYLRELNDRRFTTLFLLVVIPGILSGITAIILFLVLFITKSNDNYITITFPILSVIIIISIGTSAFFARNHRD
jgi:hypothetical protein